MTIPPDAVIALRELITEIRRDAAGCQILASIPRHRLIEYALVARVEPPSQEQDDTSRCAVCGASLVETTSYGCVRGNCSQRPFPRWLYAPERAALEYGEDLSRFDRRALLARVEPQEGTLNEFGLPEQLYPNTLQSYRAVAARVERELVEAKRVEALGDREVYEANHDRDVWHRAYHETKARAEKAERELSELNATARVEPPPQEQTLLEKAVDDREAHPWRYYRFEREELLKWLDKVADERDALRAVLAAPPSPPTQEKA